MQRYLRLICGLPIWISCYSIYASEKPDAEFNWGQAVQGLQFGIRPVRGQDGVIKSVFDGKTVCVEIQLRNIGENPVRLLAPIYTCLLGGGKPLFISKLVLSPQNGDPAIVATYRG